MSDATTEERIYFKVPFGEKDLAKKNGAKWDRARRKWWFSPDLVTDFVTSKWEKLPPRPQKPKGARVASVSAPDGSRIIRGWFDGGSRGNPGVWGYGSLLRHGNGKMIGTRMGSGTKGTNNEAEYKGLISLMEMLRDEILSHPPDPKAHVYLYGDSDLVIRQVNGEWKCNADNLKRMNEHAMTLLKELSSMEGIESVTIEHVYREKNAEADNLANIAMDRV